MLHQSPRRDLRPVIRTLLAYRTDNNEAQLQRDGILPHGLNPSPAIVERKLRIGGVGLDQSSRYAPPTESAVLSCRVSSVRVETRCSIVLSSLARQPEHYDVCKRHHCSIVIALNRQLFSTLVLLTVITIITTMSTVRAFPSPIYLEFKSTQSRM